jgi:hypothetical protein
MPEDIVPTHSILSFTTQGFIIQTWQFGHWG